MVDAFFIACVAAGMLGCAEIIGISIIWRITTVVVDALFTASVALGSLAPYRAAT